MFLVEENHFFFLAARHIKGYRLRFFGQMLLATTLLATFFACVNYRYQQPALVSLLTGLVFGPFVVALFYGFIPYIRGQKIRFLLIVAHVYQHYAKLAVLYLIAFIILNFVNSRYFFSTNIYLSFILMLARLFSNFYFSLFFIISALGVVDSERDDTLWMVCHNTWQFLASHSKFILRCLINVIVWFLIIAWVCESLSIVYFYSTPYFLQERGNFDDFYAFSLIIGYIYATPTLCSILAHLYLLKRHLIFVEFWSPTLYNEQL